MGRGRSPHTIALAAGHRPILHVDRMVYWSAPLRAAVQKNPALKKAARRWASTRLSDLAFAIDARLRYLPLIIADINACLGEVHRRLPTTAPKLSEYLNDPRGPVAVTTPGPARLAHFRLLFLVTSFIAESRACFENQAEFLRLFSRDVLGQPLGNTKAGYKALTRMVRRRRWARQLKNIRDDLLHRRSLFLAYDPMVTGGKVRYEAVFLLNWRPNKAHVPKDRVPMTTLQGISDGLREVAAVLSRRLTTRAQRAQGPIVTVNRHATDRGGPSHRHHVPPNLR